MDWTSRIKKRYWGRRHRNTSRTPSSIDQEDTAGGSPTPNSPLNLERPRSESAPESHPPTFPGGVQVLHECPNAAVDICFVHGLNGNRESTWTAHGQSRPWPETFLPQKLKNARVLTYGYDAYVVRGGAVSLIRLAGHATNLLNDLSTDREGAGASSRPLIFVAHSLGGLICKKAILLSRNKPEDYLQSIFNHTKGVVFMGTPHRGSWMADYASVAASIVGLAASTNKWLLDFLKADSQLLESIQDDFWSMIRQLRENGRNIRISCVYEELPLPGFRKPVVSQNSATHDGYPSYSIHADHREMVRFGSMEDVGLKRLLGDLGRWITQVEDEVNFALDPKLPSSLVGCQQSLSFREMNDRSRDIDPATDGTCKWLPEHSTYRSWDTCERGLLWIMGNPGSGKSTLIRHALDNATTTRQADDLVLSFFFHGRGTDLQKNPLGFFRSVLHQLLCSVPHAFPALVFTYQERCQKMGTFGQDWHWHLDELQDFFKSSLPKVLESHSIRLFVDALDECGEENAVELAGKFKTWLQQLPPTASRFHICFTCRHYPIIDSDLDYGSVICPERENGKDITTYVQACGEAIPHSIQEAIIGRAAGVFMWARLVMERVLRSRRHGVGWVAIEDGISHLPEKLHDLYTELLQDLSGGEKACSLKLLEWICFAESPLSPEELRWAMIVDVDCPYKSLRECRGAEDYDNDMEKRLKTLSRGLAEVVSAPEKGLVVQFIHQSVRDFFIGNGLSVLMQGDEAMVSQASILGHTHYRLSGTCLRYLAMEEIALSIDNNTDRNEIESTFPFLRYATVSWVKHMAQIDTIGEPQAQDFLALLAWPSNALINRWSRVYSLPRAPSLLHLVSKTGALELLKAILQMAEPRTRVADTNAKYDGSCTPLQYARMNDYERNVKSLLKGGLDYTKDYNGWTPLHYASRHGHETIVRLLLEWGANVGVGDEDCLTPLHCASRHGHEATVKLLLEGGADVCVKDHFGWTALHEAAREGNETIVKLLLNEGADVNALDVEDGWGPLHCATKNCHEAIVRILLERGADAGGGLNSGFTPLYYAAKYGSRTMVEILWQWGAGANIKGIYREGHIEKEDIEKEDIKKEDIEKEDIEKEDIEKEYIEKEDIEKGHTRRSSY